MTAPGANNKILVEATIRENVAAGVRRMTVEVEHLTGALRGVGAISAQAGQSQSILGATFDKVAQAQATAQDKSISVAERGQARVQLAHEKANARVVATSQAAAIKVTQIKEVEGAKLAAAAEKAALQLVTTKEREGAKVAAAAQLSANKVVAAKEIEAAKTIAAADREAIKTAAAMDRMAAKTGAATKQSQGLFSNLGGSGPAWQQMLRGAAATTLGIGLMTGGLVAAGAMLGQFAAQSAQTAVRMETLVAAVDTIADINVTRTTQQLYALSFANERVNQTSEELAKGLYDVFGTIDVTGRQSMHLLTVSAEAATGGLTDVKTAGSAILPILNAYDKEVDEARQVSDILFNTVDRGRISFAELANGVGLVVPAAKLAGLSLEETMAAVGATSRVLGNASTTITDMQNLFNKLTTKQAQEEFEKLGVRVTDFEGNFRPLGHILADAQARLSGLSEAARAAKIQEIFPDIQARAGFTALLDSIEEYNTQLEINKRNTDSTAKAAQIMGETTEAALNRMTNALKAGGGLLAGFFILKTVKELELLNAKLQEAARALGLLPPPLEAAFTRYTSLAKAVHDVRMEHEELLTSLRGTMYIPNIEDIRANTPPAERRAIAGGQEQREINQAEREAATFREIEAEKERLRQQDILDIKRKAAGLIDETRLEREARLTAEAEKQWAEFVKLNGIQTQIAAQEAALKTQTDALTAAIRVQEQALKDLTYQRDLELGMLELSIAVHEDLARKLQTEHATALRAAAAEVKRLRTELETLQKQGADYLKPFEDSILHAQIALENLRAEAAKTRGVFDQLQSSLDSARDDLDTRQRATMGVLDDEIRGYRDALREIEDRERAAFRPLDDAIYNQERGLREMEAALRDVTATFDRELIPLQREMNSLQREQDEIERAREMRQKRVGIENLRAQLLRAAPGSFQARALRGQIGEQEQDLNISTRRDELQGEIDVIEEARRAAVEAAQARLDAAREEIQTLRDRRDELARGFELERRGVEDGLRDAERRREAQQRLFDGERERLEASQRLLDKWRKDSEDFYTKEEASLQTSLAWAQTRLLAEQRLVDAWVGAKQAELTAYEQFITDLRETFAEQERLGAEGLLALQNRMIARGLAYGIEITAIGNTITKMQEAGKAAEEEARRKIDASRGVEDALRREYAWIAAIEARRRGTAPGTTPNLPPGYTPLGQSQGEQDKRNQNQQDRQNQDLTQTTSRTPLGGYGGQTVGIPGNIGGGGGDNYYITQYNTITPRDLPTDQETWIRVLQTFGQAQRTVQFFKGGGGSGQGRVRRGGGGRAI